MSQTIGIVDVSALSFSCNIDPAEYQPSCADRAFLAQVVRRATESVRLERVVVLFPNNDRLDDFAASIPNDVEIYTSLAPDALSKLADVVDRFEADSMLRVRADALYVDPIMIDQLVEVGHASRATDYVTFCNSDGQPAICPEMGVLAEWCTTRAVVDADARCVATDDRRLGTHYIFSNPQDYNLRMIPLPPELDRQDLGLFCRHLTQFEDLEDLADAFGWDTIDWREMVRWSHRHEVIR